MFSLGFTLVFGVLGVVNLAHGAFFMLGAYASLQAVTFLKLPLSAAILISMAATAALGWVIDKFIFARLRARRAPHLAPMVATIGVAICSHERGRGLFRRGKFALPSRAFIRRHNQPWRRAEFVA